MPGRMLVGVLMGEASTPGRARFIAEQYRPCPYCVLLANLECALIGIFSLPEEQRWWLEWVADHPHETLGLRRAEVFFTTRVMVSGPWARGEICAQLERAPCGAECRTCPLYRGPCGGCPATAFHDLSRQDA